MRNLSKRSSVLKIVTNAVIMVAFCSQMAYAGSFAVIDKPASFHNMSLAPRSQNTLVKALGSMFMPIKKFLQKMEQSSGRANDLKVQLETWDTVSKRHREVRERLVFLPCSMPEHEAKPPVSYFVAGNKIIRITSREYQDDNDGFYQAFLQEKTPIGMGVSFVLPGYLVQVYEVEDPLDIFVNMLFQKDVRATTASGAGTTAEVSDIQEVGYQHSPFAKIVGEDQDVLPPEEPEGSHAPLGKMVHSGLPNYTESAVLPKEVRVSFFCQGLGMGAAPEAVSGSSVLPFDFQFP